MSTTDELVVDNLPIAVGVLHEGRRIAVCAVPRNAHSIGQLRTSFAHRLRKAVDALLAVHEGGTDAGASRIGDGRIELVLNSEFLPHLDPESSGRGGT